jgi:hypothetical protein
MTYPSQEEMRRITIENPMPSSEATRDRVAGIVQFLKDTGEWRMEVGDHETAFTLLAAGQFLLMILQSQEAWAAAYKAMCAQREFDRARLSGGQTGSA